MRAIQVLILLLEQMFLDHVQRDKLWPGEGVGIDVAPCLWPIATADCCNGPAGEETVHLEMIRFGVCCESCDCEVTGGKFVSGVAGTCPNS
jgi:hypothetical protein